MADGDPGSVPPTGYAEAKEKKPKAIRLYGVTITHTEILDFMAVTEDLAERYGKSPSHVAASLAALLQMKSMVARR